VITNIKANEKTFALYPTSAKIYLPDGKVPEVGTICYNRDLAKTMKKVIAAEDKARFLGRKKAIEAGRDVFYKGEVAESIAKFYKENNGLISMKDLADFKAEWVEPISTNYRGYDIYTLPPNSSAIAILEELNVMEGYNVKDLGHNSSEYIHLMTEAIKLARADRWKYVADPDFIKAPIKGLVSKAYANKQRARIDPKKAAVYEQLSAGNPEDTKGSTTHMCAADRNGNLVSLTNTLGSAFGSRVVVGDTGLFFSNGMNWADLQPDSVNKIEGGKRPRWNMCPTLVVKDGKPFMAIGTPGGEGIWQTIPQLIMNIIDFGMNIQDAIEAPRFIDSLGVELRMEDRIPAEVQKALEKKGHKVKFIGNWTMAVGGMNGIMIDPASNAFMGGADPRREGYVIGW